MQPRHTVTPARLPDVLMRVAPVRPVHVWGPPGIGKSDLVAGFAEAVGLPCVSVIGSALAPEDLSGVPELFTGADGVTRSRFAPPANIARTEPFVLFLDELNASPREVQTAFYPLVLEQRLGDYQLPPGSVVIAAGNRATDGANNVGVSPDRVVKTELRQDSAATMRWSSGWTRQAISTASGRTTRSATKSEIGRAHV